MIRHIVLVRFRESVDDAERAAVMAGLAALRAAVPGVLSFASGPNLSREGRAAGYGHAFVMDFPDEAARDAYLVHPAHVAAAGRLVRAAEDGPGGILVVDVAADPAAGPASA